MFCSVIVGILSIVLLAQFLTKGRKKNNFVKGQLPGPKSYPFIGTLDVIKHRNDILGYFHKYSTMYPSIFETWIGGKPIVVLTDCDLIQKVLTTPQLLDKPEVYTSSDLKFGLISAKYSVWRVHRKLLSSTFNMKILEKYLSVFDEKSKLLVERLRKYDDNTEFDILELVSKYTLESVCATTMNMEVSRAEADKTITFFKRFLEEISYRITNVHLHPKFLYKLTRHCTNYIFVRTFLRKTIDEMIVERKEIIAQTVIASDDDSFKPQILIDQLITISNEKNSTNHLTNREISDECFTMVIAGSETSALTISFTMLMLAMYPDVQAKVFKEISDLEVTLSESMCTQTLKRFTYLEQVIKESLRLFPVFPLAIRRAMTDVDIGPCILKTGTSALINIFSLHRRKDVWGENANEFEPERFAEERMVDKHPYCFIPFSAGPRNCLGYRYAMLKIKMIFIHMLKKYQFTTDLKYDELKLNFSVSLSLQNKHLVKITER